MGDIAELRRRAQRTTSNLYDTLFTRRVSIYLTALLYPLGVSANAVSALNVLVGLTACNLIAFGSGVTLFVGIACVHLFAVLDSVDGELARLRRTFSVQGLFLEDLAGYTMINGVFLAVGAYLGRTTACWWPLALAIIVVAFGRNAMQVARRALLKSIATRRPVAPELRGAGPVIEGSRLRTFVEKQLLHYTNVWIVLTTAIIIEQVAGLQLVIYLFTGYAVLVLLKELAVIAVYLRSDSLDRQLAAIYRDASTLPTDPVDGADLAGR